MSKHTSGPWELRTEESDGVERTVIYPDVSFPGMIATVATRMNYDEELTNGYLLNAAPELLEACKASLEDCKADGVCASRTGFRERETEWR